MRKLIFLALLIIIAIIAFAVPIKKAHAEMIQFFCTSEAAMNTLAAKTAYAYDEENAKPFIDEGVCAYLPFEAHIDVVRHGKSFAGQEGVVEVVEFLSESGAKLYAMITVEQSVPRSDA